MFETQDVSYSSIQSRIMYMLATNIYILNLHFKMQSMASCPPRFLSVNKARNLSVNGLKNKTRRQ